MFIPEITEVWGTTWVVVGAIVLVFVVSAVVSPMLVRRGLKTPAGLRVLN